jgi:formylglycine-generating enzyme required for sulfatase activity
LIMKQQLFRLLTEFKTWQNGQALSEVRLVQHELVQAHLARLYSNLTWNAQQFGLCPSYPLIVDIQQDRPVALSELLAVTATGKLLVCAEAEVPECDNPIENNGLFAIARPLPLPETQQETLPDFPFYQVQLEWRTWQAGIDEFVKTGEGLPLGRFENGQWDANYIPPVMNLATDQILSQQATELMKRVEQLARRDSQLADLVVPLLQTDWTTTTPRAFWQAHYRCLVALKEHPKLAEDSAFHAKVSELVLFEGWEMAASLVLLGAVWDTIEKRFDNESARQKSMAQLMKRVEQLARRDSQLADLVVPLRQMDWTTATPRAFWQSHCRCLMALKAHPKLVEDRDYQDCVSTLLSASFSLSMFGDGLEPLRFAWRRVEQGLERPAKRPSRYVSLGWYVTSLVAIVLVAVLLGMDLVYQYDNSINDLKAELVALDNKQAETAQALRTELAALDNKQSDRLTVVDDKLSEQLTTLDNKQAETAQALRAEITALDSEHEKKADDLSKRLTELDNKHAKQLTEVDNKQSKQLAEVDNKQSKQLAEVDDKHVQRAEELSKQLTAVDNKLVQKAGDLSKQLTELDDKQAQTAQALRAEITTVDSEHEKKAGDLSKRVTALDNKQAQTADNLSNKLTAVDNEHDEKADELSKRLTGLSNKQAQTAADLSNKLTELDDKHVQRADELSKQLTAVDNKLVQKAGDLSKQLTELDDKQAQTAQALRAEITALDSEHDKKAAKLSKRITALETKHVQKADKSSKPAAKKADKTDWTPGKVVRDRLTDGSYGPEMVVIPAGKFRMGDIQGGGYSNEQPVHEVSIKSFAMGRYEVTFAEYDKFAEATGRNKPSDSGWGRGNRPVINVSWHDATAYANWLTEQTGHQYRLPTEAEWEYAARAGTETKYWWGNDVGSNQANCAKYSCRDSFEYTAPVGSFKPNPFGLYETAGNVWEWTCSEYQDKYTGKEQHCAKSAGRFAARGASWGSGASWARSAFRFWGTPTYRDVDDGVRLARIQ